MGSSLWSNKFFPVNRVLIQLFHSSKRVKIRFKAGVTHDEVKAALAEAVNFSVREVLSDEETLDQLKIFIFFLLRKF